MRNLSFVFMIIALAVISVPKSYASTENHSSDAMVYYYGFGIQRITGIHEDEIESLGCKYTISTQSFLSLLSSATTDRSYNSLDVRAEVIFAPSKIYFIDRFGMVRMNDQKFSISKQAFAKLLVPVGRVCGKK